VQVDLADFSPLGAQNLCDHRFSIFKAVETGQK